MIFFRQNNPCPSYTAPSHHDAPHLYDAPPTPHDARPSPHDDRKGRHYYTRTRPRFARPLNETHASEASTTVYSSDDPCGRHGGGGRHEWSGRHGEGCGQHGRGGRPIQLLFLLFGLISLLLLVPSVAHADGGAPNLAYVAGGPKGISTIDIGQEQVTGTISVAGDPRMLVLSLDGRFLYVAQPALNRVSMLAARTGETVCSANIGGQPSLLAFDPTPNANMLYAGGNGEASVSAIDPSNCKITRTFKMAGPVYGLAIAVVAAAGRGNQLWVASTSSVTIFDTQSGQQLDNIPIAGGPQYVNIPQGTTVYLTTRQGNVDAIDLNTHKVTTLLTGGSFGPMDYDAITGEVYVPDLKNEQLDVLNPLSPGAKIPPEPNRVYKLGVAPQSVAITSDGQLGFIALSGGNVAMLDVPGRQIVNTIHVGGEPSFIITGLYPPVIGTTPQQASIWGTVVSIIAYAMVIVLLIVPFLLFRRFNQTEAKKAEMKKLEVEKKDNVNHH